MSTPKLDLTKLVSKSKAQLGEVISYTLLLTNTGNGPATNVVVRDSISSTVLILPGSVLTSTGTFSISSPVNVWTIASLPAGATATLAFSGSLTAAGIHYNTATIPGDTNTVCTTVPIKVCQGSDFAFQLNAPTQYSNYQWYRNGTAIPLATGSSYTATQVGDYTVQRINGQCPGGTCCPVIIEADSVALFTVRSYYWPIPLCDYGGH
jgi:uncharacterized repeat protein (TIGR01451 family)